MIEYILRLLLVATAAAHALATASADVSTAPTFQDHASDLFRPSTTTLSSSSSNQPNERAKKNKRADAPFANTNFLNLEESVQETGAPSPTVSLPSPYSDAEMADAEARLNRHSDMNLMKAQEAEAESREEIKENIPIQPPPTQKTSLNHRGDITADVFSLTKEERSVPLVLKCVQDLHLFLKRWREAQKERRSFAAKKAEDVGSSLLSYDIAMKKLTSNRDLAYDKLVALRKRCAHDINDYRASTVEKQRLEYKQDEDEIETSLNKLREKAKDLNSNHTHKSNHHKNNNNNKTDLSGSGSINSQDVVSADKDVRLTGFALKAEQNAVLAESVRLSFLRHEMVRRSFYISSFFFFFLLV
jgi:hypothetical protein